MQFACNKATPMRTTDTMAGAGSTADGDCDLSLLPDLPDPAIKVCRDHCCVWIIVHYERAREGLCIAHGLAGTAVAARGGVSPKHCAIRPNRGLFSNSNSNSTHYHPNASDTCNQWPRLPDPPLAANRIRSPDSGVQLAACCLLTAVLLLLLLLCCAASCRQYAHSCPCSPAAGPAWSAAAGGAWGC